MRTIKLFSMTAILIAPLMLSTIATAEDKRAMMKPGDSDAPIKILAMASNTYRTLQKSSGGIPSSVTSKAQCVVIVPETVTAAVVIGGTHGNGVASCKTNGQWSSPAFIDLTGGSLGAQIGGKSSDIVLYLTSTAAAESLKKGKLVFGADASVVAGNFDRSFDYGSAGVVAYENTSGAYVGASLNAGTLSQDDESNRAFYGKESTTSTILTGKENSKIATDSAKEFISQLPA